jgi:hypothetical protein
VPGAQQVEGRVGRGEPADVEDPGQASAGRDEHVARHEVAVVHDVPGIAARQIPQRRPHPAQPNGVEQPLAALEAGFQPLVVVAQIAAAAAAGERPDAGGDRPDAGDELRQVERERDRLPRVGVGCHGVGCHGVGCHDAWQPGLHRPRQRVARARLAQRDRLRGSEPGPPGELGGRLRLQLQHAQDRDRIPGFEREPGRVAVADAEDRVDRPGPGHRPDRQRLPLRELPVDQGPRRLGRDVQLVLMHPHTARVADGQAGARSSARHRRRLG